MLARLGRELRAGSVRAVELCEASLRAAEAAQPALNAFVTLDGAAALETAARADAELAAGRDRGPLHGIPVAVKDLIDTAGLATEMGSRQFTGRVPARDAACVAALREAGAVVIGKTLTHEVAVGPTGDVSATGACRNPRDPARMAGGSSAGSAAAVAAGIVPFALGTDTGGSVRIPAALCGCAGLRPSPGRIPRAGVLALSPALDEVGPLAGSAEDLALAFAALVGGGGPVPSPPPGTLRVGVVEHPWFSRADPAVAAGFASALDDLATAGAELRSLSMPDVEELSETYRLVQSGEAVAVHAERLAATPERFEPETLERLRAAQAVPTADAARAAGRLRELRALAGERLAGLDLLLAPSVPILPPPIGDRGPQPGGWPTPRAALLAFTAPFSVLGLPCLTLAGGLQLVGRPGGDEALLAAARTIEWAVAPPALAQRGRGSPDDVG